MSCRASAWGAPPESGQSWRGTGWRPWELAAMIAGFVLFWPVGLAILAWKGWKEGWWGQARRWQEAPAGAGWGCGWQPGGNRWTRHELRRDSGNMAFEDYKAAEIGRLEAEYKRLVDEQKAFGEFLRDLHRARDKAEFDQFVASRRKAQETGSGARPETSGLDDGQPET